MAIGDKLGDQVAQDCPQLGTPAAPAGAAIVPKEGVVSLRCECGTIWAQLQNGCLVVKARHHGEEHVNAVAVSELVKMC